MISYIKEAASISNAKRAINSSADIIDHPLSGEGRPPAVMTALNIWYQNLELKSLDCQSKMTRTGKNGCTQHQRRRIIDIEKS